MAAPFDDVELAAVRRRSSAKWRRYPPDVLPAWVAEMDFPLAPPLVALLTRMVAESDTGYGWPDGLPEALALDCERRYGWSVDPGRVLLVGDVISGLAAVLRALTRPGDGVVVNPPVYAPFFSTITDVTGRRVVEAPLASEGTAYRLDLEALERAFRGDDVTAYVLCNPHNPTGLVLPREDLEAVSGLAARHGVVVVSDEVHAPLVLPGARHVPYLALGDEVADRAVVLTSASKAFNIPGLKCAQIVSGSAAMARTLSDRIPMEVRFGAGLFGIRAQEVAFREGQPWLDRVLATLDRNRALLGELLADRLPGVRYRPPQASYLAWLDFGDLGLGPDPARILLERGRVALSAGPDFGTGGAGFARLNMATSPQILGDIVDRMAAAVE